MLKTNTEILNQTYRHKGFYNSNPALPFRPFIIKNPVIVSIKSKTDPPTKIQTFFDPSLPSATKGIVAKLRNVGTNPGAVTGHRHQCKM